MGGIAKKGFMSQFRPFEDIGQVGKFLGHMGAKPNAYVPQPPPAAHPATMGSAASQLKAQGSTNASGSSYYGSTVGTSPQGLTKKAGGAKSTLLGQ